MISGSYDYFVKFWHFGGMNAAFNSFRQIEPASGYQVVGLDYNYNGEFFVVATTSAQAKIYDREGFEK
jgi:hypothetical protein